MGDAYAGYWRGLGFACTSRALNVIDPLPSNKCTNILVLILTSTMSTTMPEPTAFGAPMLAHFQFDPAFKNLNHGMYPLQPLDPPAFPLA